MSCQLEVIYRTSKVVSNVCVYAAAEHAKPVAIVVPDWKGLKEVSDMNGVQVESLEEAIHDQQIQAAALKELQAVAKRGGLSGIEIIDAVVLVEDEWTSENVSTTLLFV